MHATKQILDTAGAARSSEGTPARANLEALGRIGVDPIKVWGSIGFIFAIIQLYALGRWIASDKFAATPTGADVPPAGYLGTVQFWQATTVAFGIGMLIWGIRSCLREKRITTSLLMVLAWLSVYWQDALAGYFRMFITYSSYFFNRGSWYPFVPGWISPNAEGISEPLLFNFGNYGGTLPLLTVIGAWGLGAYRRKNPRASLISLVVATLVLGMLLDFVVEFAWVRTGLYAFPSTFGPLTLFSGQINQYPLYETFFFGPVIGTAIFLYYFRDDKGNILVDRGVEKLRYPATRVGMRFLALSGVMNSAFLVFYTLPVWFVCFHNDATVADVPSYLLNGICGAGTQYECPGPNVHVPLPGSGPIPPFSGRN